jgi:hypothetical protein
MRNAVLQPTSFAVAWTLVAVYCAALLVVAVRIGVQLVRARGRDEDRAV